jgi:hypothetical protein
MRRLEQTCRDRRRFLGLTPERIDQLAALRAARSRRAQRQQQPRPQWRRDMVPRSDHRMEQPRETGNQPGQI